MRTKTGDGIPRDDYSMLCLKHQSFVANGYCRGSQQHVCKLRCQRPPVTAGRMATRDKRGGPLQENRSRQKTSCLVSVKQAVQVNDTKRVNKPAQPTFLAKVVFSIVMKATGSESRRECATNLQYLVAKVTCIITHTVVQYTTKPGKN